MSKTKVSIKKPEIKSKYYQKKKAVDLKNLRKEKNRLFYEELPKR